MYKPLIIVAISVLGAMLFFSLVFGTMFVEIGRFLNDPTDDAQFDRDVWLQHRDDSGSDNPRFTMLADLCSNVLKAGMTRQEVLDRLGPSDESATDRLSYTLGDRSHFGFDLFYLSLEFDSADRLRSMEIVGH